MNDEENNIIDSIENINEPTEQFIPTTRTTTKSTTTSTTTKRKEEITTKAFEEAENEIFDDFFDQQNDFFAASSTVSPVVFKGSPGPGFFSSPRPFFDNNGKVGRKSLNIYILLCPRILFTFGEII